LDHTILANVPLRVWGNFPIGAQSFFEARAFIIQLEIIKKSFGEKVSYEVYDYVADKKNGWLYCGIFELAESVFPEITFELLLIILDYALMGGEFVNCNKFKNPAYRFLLLLSEMKKISLRISKANVMTAIEKLSNLSRDLSVKVIGGHVEKWINKNIEDTENKIKKVPSIICYINNIFYKYSREVYKRHNMGFSLMSDLTKYFNCLPIFVGLGPPILIEKMSDQNILKGSLGGDQEFLFGYNASYYWGYWFFLQNLVLQIVNSETIECPLIKYGIECSTKYNHCDKNILSTSKEKLPACIWKIIADSLGLNRIEINCYGDS
jgi:hypothetical protein